MKRVFALLLLIGMISSIIGNSAPVSALSDIRRPTGDDSNTCAATSTGANRWSVVDEDSPASDADYYTMVTNNGGRVTMSAAVFAVPATASIINVTIYYRGNNSGTASFRPSMKIGTTYYDTTLGSVRDPSAWTTYSDAITTNPKTGIGWTVSDLNRSGGDSANYLNAFGTASTDCKPENTISWVYIEVNYTTYDISNTPNSKAFSTVAANSTYYAKGSAPSNPVVDGDCTYAVTNDGSAAVDISIKATNFTGGVGWTLASSVGLNQVKVVSYKTGDNPASGIVLTTSGQAFISNLAAAAHTHWDFSLNTGTFADGVAKSSTITLTSTIH